jgi:hypothetical protein
MGRGAASLISQPPGTHAIHGPPWGRCACGPHRQSSFLGALLAMLIINSVLLRVRPYSGTTKSYLATSCENAAGPGNAPERMAPASSRR